MIRLKVQEWIHSFEVGAGARFVQAIFVGVAFVALAVAYDAICYRNFATEEAMDNAQVARNVSEGKGFSTQLVRPFSIFLLSRHEPKTQPSTLINDGHPDLANPPAYPLLLAGLFKLVPARDLLEVKNFLVVRRELAVTLLNQVLLLVSTLLVYRLGRRLFNPTVGLVAALVFAGTELFWRFSVSGLSTNLVIVLVLLLVLSLLRMEEAAREEQVGTGSLYREAVIAGLLLASLGLTRYATLFMVVPVVIFVMAHVVRARAGIIIVMLAVATAALAPWLIRNVSLTGTPFGVAGYAWLEQTRPFPEDHLHRSLKPELAVPVGEYVRKLVVNTREVVLTDVPKMGGSWIWAFFIAGLVVPFRSPALSRVRWFTVAALLVLIPVQAMGKTQIWTDSPAVNSENLLVLLSPLVLVLGVGVLFVLLDSIAFPWAGARLAAVAGAVAVFSLPLLLTFLPPHPQPIAYPPYYPPRIQQVGSWLDTDDWIMTDIPGGVAWYGNRTAIQLTSRRGEEFLQIHDFIKPLNGLYLTTRTTERRFLTELLRGDTTGWESFVMELLGKQEVPTKFPLRRAPAFFFNQGQILLMDYDRWARQNP